MLRNFLFILIIAVIGINAGKAQDNKSFAFGLKACPTIAWMKPNAKDYSSDGIQIGFTYGVFGDFFLSKNVAFSTGVNVNYHGGKLHYPDSQLVLLTPTQGTFYRKYNFQAIQVPIMIKMKTDEIANMKFYANVGIAPAYLIKAKANKDEYTTNVGSSKVQYVADDITSDINRLRASMIIGLGVEYPIKGNTAVVAGINFDNGLTNVLKGNNAVDVTIKQKAITNYLELNLGIIF